MASKRKPYNDDAGYVCSRKLPGNNGHVVVYDREKGGDWIDGSTRWIVSHYDSEGRNDGLIDQPTKADAIGLMKDTVLGETDWFMSNYGDSNV